MPDREKVIRGLEHCLKYFEADGFEDCADCPYNDGDVVGTCESMTPLVADALALLREREARVMTMDELAEIYVEFKGSSCPIRLPNFDLQKIIMYANDGICRLWTGKPTDEQRKAVKWDA